MTNEISEIKCGHCASFNKNPVVHGTGTCHRYPVTVPKREDDWCAEWMDRKMSVRKNEN